MEIFKEILQILLVYAALLGSVAAIEGVKTWKSQIKAKAEYDLARRILHLVYQFRENVNGIRSPLISGGEIIQARKEQAKNLDLTNISSENDKDSYYVYQSRYDRLSKIYSSLNIELLEAKVIWGDKLKNVSYDLKKVLIDLKITLTRWLGLNTKNHLSDKDWEKISEYDKIIYDTSSESKPDDFSNNLNKIVCEFEDLLKNYLEIRD